MKKFIFLLFLLLVSLLIYIVVNGDAQRYAEREAITICEWLNSDKAKTDFRVGPHAFEHLLELKNKDKQYTCKAVSSEHMYGYKDEIAVVFSVHEQDKIMLIYGLGLSGRNFYQPRYFQHWTGNKVKHHD